MPPKSFEDRVELLEKKVTPLEQLPARMTALEGQIVQFREEMRGEFSTVCTELRAEMKAQGESLRTEIVAAIESGDERTRVYMRVLFEKHEADTRLMNEGNPKPTKRRVTKLR